MSFYSGSRILVLISYLFTLSRTSTIKALAPVLFLFCKVSAIWSCFFLFSDDILFLQKVAYSWHLNNSMADQLGKCVHSEWCFKTLFVPLIQNYNSLRRIHLLIRKEFDEVCKGWELDRLKCGASLFFISQTSLF